MFTKYLSCFWNVAIGVVSIGAMAISTTTTVVAQLETGWKSHDLERPVPPVVTPGDQVQSTKPPSDAIVLFDGQDLNQWTGGVDKWKVVDGAMVPSPKSGYVTTKEEFGDCQLHIEWASPAKPQGAGLQRGNSGVFLMGGFELQVLDSYNNKTYADGGAASIYGQHPPLVNACRKPGQWQTYDIIFHAPKFGKDGNLEQRARVTVLHNGVLVQDAVEILGPTSWIKHGQYVKGKTKGPISLQDNGTPVRYRNIWARRLQPTGPQPQQPYPVSSVKLTSEQLDRLVGKYKVDKQGAFHIHRDGDDLLCQLYRVRMKMVALSESNFAFKECAGEITFEFDSAGKTTQAKLNLAAAGERVGIKQKQTKKQD